MHRLIVSRHFDDFVKGTLGLLGLGIVLILLAAEVVGLAVLFRLIAEAVR